MIDQHKKRIESSLKSLPDDHKHLEQVRRLPGAWRPRILIVEDDAQLAQLLSIFLATEGDVETAENGKRALRKTSVNHFDVIISDVNMPVMSGIEFYKQAAEVDPSIGKRFLFFTGYITNENIGFFTKNGLKYMEKPLPLDEVRQAVQDIMRRASGHP